MLLTIGTHKSASLHVLGLHMDLDHGVAVGGKATLSTSELTVLSAVHERLDGLLHVI